MTIRQTEYGTTEDGQVIVADGGAVAQAETDSGGVLLSNAPKTQGSSWRDSDGDIAGRRPDAPESGLPTSLHVRAFCLQNDASHPANSGYGFQNSRSINRRNSRRREHTLDLTFNAFSDVLNFDRHTAHRLAQGIECPTGVNRLGGLRLVAVASLVEASAYSLDQLWFSDEFRESFKQHFAETPADSRKCFRQVAMLAGDADE